MCWVGGGTPCSLSAVGFPAAARRTDEIYFSILQRKAISPGDFDDLDHLAERVLAFQNRYNAAASPFDWTYTRYDLNTFLRRLDTHDLAHTPRNAACPRTNFRR